MQGFSKMNMSKKVLFSAIALVIVAGVAGYMKFGGQSALSPVEPKKVGIAEYVKQSQPVTEGFLEAMKAMGYKEGRDVVYVREEPANGDEAKLKTIIDGYLADNVDLIFAVTSVSARVALAETKAQGKTNIPVVYAHANQVVEQKLAQSFRSSGNNMTGVVLNFTEITEKKLEFLKKINPNIKKVAVFDAAVTDPAGRSVMVELEKAAPKFGLTVVKYALKKGPGAESIQEAKDVIAKMKPGEFDAYIHLPGNVVSQEEFIKVAIDMTKSLKVLSAWLVNSDAEKGGLLAYGHDLEEMGKQSAVYVDKVFKGTLPTDIPIEFPQKNSLAVNLKTAREIGVTIPPDLLSIADVTIR